VLFEHVNFKRVLIFLVVARAGALMVSFLGYRLIASQTNRRYPLYLEREAVSF